MSNGLKVVTRNQVEGAAWALYVDSFQGENPNIKTSQKPVWKDPIKRVQFTRQAVEALESVGVKVQA